MLKVIEGEGQPDDRLSLDDVPLGPWAGADVEVWASKTGTVWHGDPECGNAKTRRDAFRQPISGMLGSAVLPERFHCSPPGRLGIYRAACEKLVSFDAATHDAAAGLSRDDLDLSVFEDRSRPPSPRQRVDDEVVGAELRGPDLGRLHAQCLSRREAVVADARQVLDARLPVMLAAA